MGERFAAASRPGPGQWEALARALELCRTQPSACPWAPKLTCRPQAWRAWRSPGRRPQSTCHRTLCRQDHCPPDCWRSQASNLSVNAARPPRTCYDGLTSKYHCHFCHCHCETRTKLENIKLKLLFK